MSDPSTCSGVMDASYAEGRRRARHIVWRYKVRARFASDSFLARLGPSHAPRVIDLGAAEGRTLLEVRRLLGPGGQYDGFELSDELLAQAPPLPENLTLHKGDVCALGPEADLASYDLCTALAVLEHLPEPAACFEQAYRALRSGGVLVATCPHPIWDDVAGALRLVADEHHEVHMTGAKMQRLAVAAGFERVELFPFMWAPIGALPYVGISVPAERALRWDGWIRRLRVLSAGFVNQGLVAQKPA